MEEDRALQIKETATTAPTATGETLEEVVQDAGQTEGPESEGPRRRSRAVSCGTLDGWTIPKTIPKSNTNITKKRKLDGQDDDELLDVLEGLDATAEDLNQQLAESRQETARLQAKMKDITSKHAKAMDLAAGEVKTLREEVLSLKKEKLT